MQTKPAIQSHPEILGGAPVFTGTRVPVDSLTAHLRAGDSIDDFLEDFPSVKRVQVESYLIHAEAISAHEIGAR